MNFFRIIFGIFLVTLLAGCAWKGEISKDFHRYYNVRSVKAPVTIGIVVDPELMPSDVRYGVSASYRLNISNYVYGLQNELSRHFQTVKLIGHPNQCSECNFFALPQAYVQLDQFAGTAEGQIDVVFANASMQDVAHIEVHRKGTGVVGISMGTTYGYGREITKATEKIISAMLEDLGRKIKKNPYLTGRSAKSTQINIDPKYKKFLSAVAVIETLEKRGSAFFIAPDTLITNEHVVGDYVSVVVKLFDGRMVSGTVVVTDPVRDLAIVKIDDKHNVQLSLGKDKDCFIGEEVVAIGAPKGLNWTVTKGIISQTRTQAGIRYIQTDTAINSGSSGGPLLSVRTGKVVGINSMGFRGAEGLNFAVTVDELRDFLSENK